jgi:hypothetical protein
MDEEFDELEEICCYGCGAVKIQLYLNHEINDYAYRQITCYACYKEWLKNQEE